MSLYNDLTDVLTPYANKIKEVNESLGDTNFLIDRVLEVLKCCTYDNEKLPNPERAIDRLKLEAFGLYTLPAPIVCNADRYIDSGFSVATVDDFGYTDNWYLLLDVEPTATGTILGNDKWRIERQTAGTTMLAVVGTYSYEAKITGRSFGNRYKYVATYNSTTRKMTFYGVKDNALVTVSPDVVVLIPWTMYIGGRTAAQFKGTIYQLNVRLGTITENEIKDYLGVE